MDALDSSNIYIPNTYLYILTSYAYVQVLHVMCHSVDTVRRTLYVYNGITAPVAI